MSAFGISTLTPVVNSSIKCSGNNICQILIGYKNFSSYPANKHFNNGCRFKVCRCFLISFNAPTNSHFLFLHLKQVSKLLYPIRRHPSPTPSSTIPSIGSHGLLSFPDVSRGRACPPFSLNRYRFDIKAVFVEVLKTCINRLFSV